MDNGYKLYSRIRSDSGKRIANDIREREKRENYKHVDKFDKVLFEKGIEWYNSGLQLDDAPDDLKNNTNFIKGFEKAKRIKNVENSLYDLGMSYFNDGLPIQLIPENYRNNPTVLRGYEDAMKKSRSR